MTEEIFKQLIEVDYTFDPSYREDKAFEGLKILSKYTKNLLTGAEHDVIYSENIEVLIEKGITEEDVKALAKLNWFIDNEVDCLAKFV